MISFLHGLIIAVNGSACDGIHMVIIIKTVVPNIMTNSSNEHTQAIQFVHFKHLDQLQLRHHVERHLHHICSMKIVVIGYSSVVRRLGLFQELIKFILIHDSHQV